jgi:anti-sigma regulatory factor (Ser/Thr protein kinase)
MSGHELLSSRIEFIAAPGAVRRARHWIAGQLARTHPADLVDAAVLLVSELVTNAVRASAAAEDVSGYADPRRIELTVARTCETVRIEVSDSASGSLPAPSVASADDESGRGLQVIIALSERWGCRSAHRGKVVWCELAAAGQGLPAGQAPAGQAPAGQAPAGQAPAGQALAGQMPSAGQVLAAGQVPASAGCIDLSRPGSVAVRHTSPVAVGTDIASQNGT